MLTVDQPTDIDLSLIELRNTQLKKLSEAHVPGRYGPRHLTNTNKFQESPTVLMCIIGHQRNCNTHGHTQFASPNLPLIHSD